MINPSQSCNTTEVKLAEQTTPASVASVSPKREVGQVNEVVPQVDSVEISAASQQLAKYQGILNNQPDIRKDVVAQVQRAVQATIQYPPMDVMRGMVALMGNQLGIEKPGS